MLGSLPGAESLRQQRYYANPRNQFWRLMAQVTGRALEPLGYEARLEALIDAGVALWDSAHSAIRPGSLDAAIRDASPNDLAALAASMPGLRAVGFNGGTALRLGSPALAIRPDLALLPLPSSSPAYTLAFERKAEAWAVLAPFLQRNSPPSPPV